MRDPFWQAGREERYARQHFPALDKALNTLNCIEGWLLLLYERSSYQVSSGFGGDVWLSNEEAAEMCGVRVEAVEQARASLIEKGWLVERLWAHDSRGHYVLDQGSPEPTEEGSYTYVMTSLRMDGAEPDEGRDESTPGKKTISAGLRMQVFERDDFTCRQCGARTKLTADHVIPESKGGLTVLDNLQTLCRPCNAAKGTKL